jgi:hypothetical protein
LIFHLVNTDDSIAFLVHVLPQADYDVLCAGLLLYVLSKEGCVLVVEGCVDFIHEVEGEVFDFFAGEDQS